MHPMLEPGSDTFWTKTTHLVDAWCRVFEVKGSGVVVEKKGLRPGWTASQS